MSRPVREENPMREGAGREAAGEIVVGVDGGRGGREALCWAAAEASALGLGLRVVHVVEWPCLADAWPDSAVDRLASLSGAGAQIVAQGVQRVAEIAPNVSVTTLVDVGDVAWLLLRAASGATMLVVGKRRGTRPWWMR